MTLLPLFCPLRSVSDHTSVRAFHELRSPSRTFRSFFSLCCRWYIFSWPVFRSLYPSSVCDLVLSPPCRFLIRDTVFSGLEVTVDFFFWCISIIWQHSPNFSLLLCFVIFFFLQCFFPLGNSLCFKWFFFTAKLLLAMSSQMPAAIKTLSHNSLLFSDCPWSCELCR